MKKGWQTKKLGDVCTTIQDGAHESPQKQFDSPGEGRFLYITSKNIRTNYLELKNVSYVERDFHDRIYPRCSPRIGDVLLTKDGANTGNVALNTIDEPFSLLSSVCLIKTNPSALNSGFLCYYLQSPDGLKSIIGQMTGAAIKRIILRDVKLATIPLPPLVEQQRIVGLLDDAFEGLATAKANAEKNLQNARTLFESHLQSVFTQRGPGWGEKAFEDCIEDVKYTTKIQRKDFLDEGEFPIVSQEVDFTNGYWDKKEDLFKVTKPIVIFGDHTQALKYIDFDFVLGADGVKLLLPKSFLNSKFFFYALRSSPLKSLGYARHYRLLKELRIVFPDTCEQVAIAKKLDALDAETQRLASIYEQKLAALESLKKSLLHQAFSGQLTAGAINSVSPLVPVCATVTSFVPTLTVVPDITFLDLHAAIVAMGFQHHQELGNPSYGRTKAEKCGHGVEAWVGIELGRRPMKDAAGPADAERLWEVTNHAREKGYFSFEKPEGAARYRLTKGPAFDDLIAKAERALGERKAEVDQVLALMASMTRQEASLVATLHAAWNNLLLDGETVTDERIVTEARENWHSKKMDIERACFFKAIAWIREKKLIPMGKGKKVVAKSS